MSDEEDTRTFPPNPLPCGCGARGTRDLDHGEAHERWSNIHVVHCPLHAAASKLLEAVNACLRSFEHDTQSAVQERAMESCRAAVAKAEGRP